MARKRCWKKVFPEIIHGGLAFRYLLLRILLVIVRLTNKISRFFIPRLKPKLRGPLLSQQWCLSEAEDVGLG